MNKVRFATVGSNVIVDSFLAGAVHDERFAFEAVYSRTEQRGKEFASKYGVKKVYTSLEELAADNDIDAVYIATPNRCHASQAILMMEHGKHVLCEKPMAPTYKEAFEMIQCAGHNNVALMEAMKSTLLPNFDAVRAALSKIAPVRRYFAQFCQYSSRYDKFLRGEVVNAFNPEMKGGALLDLGVYGIAPMVHLFGMPARVQKSETRMAPGGVVSDKGIDVQGTLLATYPGMEGIIMYSKISDSPLPVEIQGEKGRILIRKLSQMTAPYIEYRGVTARKPGEPALDYDEPLVEDIAVETITDNMYYELREFIDMILSGRIESAENTFERTLEVLRICEM